MLVCHRVAANFEAQKLQPVVLVICARLVGASLSAVVMLTFIMMAECLWANCASLRRVPSVALRHVIY